MIPIHFPMIDLIIAFLTPCSFHADILETPRTARRTNFREKLEVERAKRKCDSDTIVLSETEASEIESVASATSPVQYQSDIEHMSDFIASEDEGPPDTSLLLPSYFQTFSNQDMFLYFVQYLARMVLFGPLWEQSSADPDKELITCGFNKLKLQLQVRAETMLSTVWSQDLLVRRND
jgi:hypothetical protein